MGCPILFMTFDHSEGLIERAIKKSDEKTQWSRANQGPVKNPMKDPISEGLLVACLILFMTFDHSEGLIQMKNQVKDFAKLYTTLPGLRISCARLIIGHCFDNAGSCIV